MTRTALVTALIVALSGLPQASSAAARIRVGNGTPASCTAAALQDALNVAAASGRAVVSFNCGRNPVTITVGATLTVPDDTTINGDGLITLDGQFGPLSILRVDRSTTATLQGLTITQGGCFGCEVSGGGLLNEGAVVIDGCTFSNHVAESGGGLFNRGTATVRASTFADNFATNGSGIFNQGTLTIHASRFIRNHL